ncbi:hypothetical protein O988_09787 [Pseudogymnoascus sp. VKM F-3808]|nr:hypothetical protein O988_09787 [Pseudogymnoascus sp. VKM F-3808]
MSKTSGPKQCAARGAPVNQPPSSPLLGKHSFITLMHPVSFKNQAPAAALTSLNPQPLDEERRCPGVWWT